MPLSPELGWYLAEPVVEVYAQAERDLLERIARSLAAGIDAPDWAERKLLEVQLLQRRTAADLIAATTTARGAASVGVAQAWNRGAATAETDIARTVLGGLRRASVVQSSLDRIIGETVDSLQAVTQRVLRALPDVYRSVIRAAAPQVLIGAQTRRQAAQVALNELADRGVTGFTDKAGRRWALDSYVEMSMRAATGRAAVDGHVTRLASRGFDLIMVSDAPQECHLCRPWEGKVLSTGPAQDASGPAVATLDEARAAGLFHPGCRHSTGIYLPGITKPLTDTEDPQGDRDRQRLRALERRVRAAKRRESVALDPQAKLAARREIRRQQAAIREHVATTSAKRQPHREQLRGGPVVTPPPLETAPPSPVARWQEGRDVHVSLPDYVLPSGADPYSPEVRAARASRPVSGPNYDPKNPLKFYGDRVHIADESQTAAANLAEFEKFPQKAHETMRRHFAKTPKGGVYVGDVGMPELDDLGEFRGVAPRGWPPGSTWDTVPGAYNPGSHVCALGGGGHGHGSTSLGLHEGSHALDDALGTASNSAEFRKVSDALAYDVDPYFSYPGNPTGWASEMFAESSAAWTDGRHRGLSGDDLARHVGKAIGAAGLSQRDRVVALVSYFDGLLT